MDVFPASPEVGNILGTMVGVASTKRWKVQWNDGVDGV